MCAGCFRKVRDFADISALSIHANTIFREALRLSPPVMINARAANKNATFPSGGGVDGSLPVLVRKEGIVVWPVWTMHRLAGEFGENPEEFYPERWEHLSKDAPGYIPFRKGPRNCPGQHYAMTVLTYIVARTFQTFSTVTNYNANE
ncbi:hypothetical protein AJ79_03747 [Helicocarpus griseus UAMH5409]|uniref:Cytochrome P450 oxidoreductase n=1 Tax=Helicocarpus griseus UAMH5409 TaxID=1447875 RepID=A0A2B7XWF0_9EURO|nr:hypothetical protein AJ79_03747 [Helicocarpus griseus UAMH5409]